MSRLFKDFFKKLFTSSRSFFLIGGIVVLLLIVLNAGYYFISDNPKTCLVCHYIRPYYNLWSKSNHQAVGCLECHPERHWLTAPYALRYVTANYAYQPIAQVKDQSCLNCHEGQSLDTSATFEGKINFNHSRHLQSSVRNVHLHCTTCHNHRQPGTYMQVDHNVCFLCHFKGAEHGHAQTGCQTCHGNPKQAVDHQGFQFNHQAYLDVGLDCGQCHIEVAKGDAGVPQEACFNCHVSRIEKFGDFTLIHETHVQKNMIDCFRCHGSIEHGKFGLISSLEVRCETCHTKLHTPEKQMYFGAGGLGIPDEPSRMFLAQVSCDGCHKKPEKIGEVKFGAQALKTQQESCRLCHGKGYDLMLHDWVQGSAEMTQEIETYLRQSEAVLRSDRLTPEMRQTLETARYNFDFVSDGKGAHNVFYAVHLLQHSVGQLKSLKEQLGIKDDPSSPGPILGATDGFCNRMCHQRMTRKEFVTYEKMNFPHQMHEQDLALGCGQCHPTNKHRQKVILREVCKNCHHQEYPLACTQCHWREEELYRGQCQTLNLKDSPDVMAAAEVKCDGCHDLSKELSQQAVALKCQECHGAGYTDLLKQWAEELEAEQAKLAVELDSAQVALAQAQAANQKVHDEQQAFEEIRHRADFIQGAGALHNYEATSGMLKTLRLKISEVRERLPGAIPSAKK